jgi:predicted enzyme related to lactoylglutathione lyase
MSTSQADQHSLAEGRAFPWHELYVPNVDAAIDFYTNALGYGTQNMETNSAFGTYKMLTVDGTPVCGLMSTEHPDLKSHEIPPHWSVYMSVDDVDARLAKCTSMGASIVVPAFDVPNVGRMALIADPQGAHIWLFKSSSA